MSDWPGKDGKLASHSNFKLSSSERPLDIASGYILHNRHFWLLR